MTFSIDDMCKAGCTTRRGVRYWEEQGLLGEVERTAGNQRRYTDAQVSRAKVIAAAQGRGWTLEECREMVETYDDEAYEAIVHRLMQQANAAATLAEALPLPQTEKVYDL